MMLRLVKIYDKKCRCVCTLTGNTPVVHDTIDYIKRGLSRNGHRIGVWEHALTISCKDDGQSTAIAIKISFPTLKEIDA